MSGITRPPIWLLSLLCLALLVARVGGTHLHLCFDGSEPLVALHVVQSGEHAGHHADDAHDDFDLSVTDGVIPKAKTTTIDLPVLLLTALLLSLLPLRRSDRPARAPTPCASSPPFLRPPLRGPPAASS